MTRPPAWTVADVLDFEHCLATQPVLTDPDGLDRKAIDALGGLQGRSRAQVFRAWLDLRRRHAGGATPGQAWDSGERLLATAAWLLGGLAGAALAGTWLAQAGDAPVNAPLFWVATVGLQFGLLLLALLGWALRRRIGLLHLGLVDLISRAGSLLRQLPGERRQALQALLATLTRRGQPLAPLMAAPALALAQRFGLTFNLGLLMSMLVLHLPLVDLRFGWQSSYPVSPAQVHQVVRVLAAPWSWALPQAQPTADEVAATRVGQGQRASELPAAAARAWWPFLALSVAVYGLLPRALLLGLVLAGQRRRLRELPFDDPPANALWRRLGGGRVLAAGGLARLPEAVESPADARRDGGSCVVLAAREMVVDDDALRDWLALRFGWALAERHALPLDDRQALADWLAPLAALRPPATAWGVLLGAERDPIVALAQGLRAVQAAAPAGVEVLLLLAPPPQADDELRAERLALWRRFVQIQQLALGVEPLW